MHITKREYDAVPSDFTLVGIFDAHLAPEEQEHESFIAAYKFIKDVKPTVIVIGGDFVTLDSLSYFNDKRPLLAEGRRYELEVKHGSMWLGKIRKACPLSDIIYIMGNHEYRVQRYVEGNPAMADTLNLERDLDLEDHGIREVVPYNQAVKIGACYYMHGWFYNMYHAKKTLQVMGHNVIYGHVHDYQVHTMSMRAHSKAYMAMCSGCLTSKNPDYKRGFPSKFVNGLVYVEYRTNGNFSPFHISIVDGELSYGGYTWSA